jgi:hypothetical protein
VSPVAIAMNQDTPQAAAGGHSGTN